MEKDGKKTDVDIISSIPEHLLSLIAQNDQQSNGSMMKNDSMWLNDKREDDCIVWEKSVFPPSRPEIQPYNSIKADYDEVVRLKSI